MSETGTIKMSIDNKKRIKALDWQPLLPKGQDNIVRVIYPCIRGIINYYSKFYPSKLEDIWRMFDGQLIKYIIKRRYKGMKTTTYKLIEELKSSSRLGKIFVDSHQMNSKI